MNYKERVEFPSLLRLWILFFLTVFFPSGESIVRPIQECFFFSFQTECITPFFSCEIPPLVFFRYIFLPEGKCLRLLLSSLFQISSSPPQLPCPFFSVSHLSLYLFLKARGNPPFPHLAAFLPLERVVMIVSPPPPCKVLLPFYWFFFFRS